MNNTIQEFQNEEFGRIEVLLIDEKPYFPATECAKVLGYSNPADAILRHCKGVVKHDTLTNGGVQSINIIPEGDLYRLIIRSKLPAAERFEKWVFDEVLPSIRKHGAYVTEETLLKLLGYTEFERDLLADLLDETMQRNKCLSDSVTALTPKARYCEMVLQSKNIVPVGVIAKDYGMSAISFNKLLNGLRIQYKTGGTWVLYQQYTGKGYTKSYTYRVNEYTSAIHTYWTQKGRLFLYGILKKHDIFPQGREYLC